MSAMDGEAAEAKAAMEGTQTGIVLLVLASVQFTNIVDFMIVMPLGAPLMEKLAISPTQFGWIVASYTYAASVAGLLAATVVDRFDRKHAFLVLYSGFLVGTFLCGLAPNYLALLAARVVTGMFGGIIGGLAMAIVGDVFPEHKRGAAMGTLMSAFSIASVLGVPIGLVIGNTYDWHAPFLALAGIGVFVLILGARALPPLGSHLTTAEAANPMIELRDILTHREHLRAFALMMALMIGAFSVVPYISPYLVDNVGVSQESLPLVYVAGGGLTLFAAPFVGKLSDRYGKFRVYRVVAPFAALFMFTVTQLPRVPLAIAVLSVATLMVCNAGRMVVAMTMITSCVEPRRRGSFLSLNSSIQHLSSGIGASIGGAIIGRAADGMLTHYNRVGYIAATFTIGSIFLASKLKPYVPPSGEVEALDLIPEVGMVEI